MSRKPIEATRMMDEYGIRKMCPEAEVRKLEAEFKQLQNKKNNSDYIKCHDPDCDGGGIINITCDKCGEGLLSDQEE